MKKAAKPKEPVYSYHDFCREMQALPFMTSIPSSRTWEKGQADNDVEFKGDVKEFLEACKTAKDRVTLKPKCTAAEYWLWASDGKHTYDELLKYGPNGRKQLLDEDGNAREAKPRGRQKGWKKAEEGIDSLDEFGMNSSENSATSKKKKSADKPKKVTSGNLRIPEMIERGILKVGAVVSIKGHDKSEATIVDGKTVKFGKKELGFNQWGIDVVGHTAVNIYKHAMYEGKLLQELRSA